MMFDTMTIIPFSTIVFCFQVILENYNAVIPSHARQLVMELGQNKTDGENDYKYNTALDIKIDNA